MAATLQIFLNAFLSENNNDFIQILNSLGSGNGWAPNGRHVITTTNADPYLWCQMSSGYNESTASQSISPWIHNMMQLGYIVCMRQHVQLI